MKKKIILGLLAAASCITLAFGLAACGEESGHTSHNWSASYTQDGDRHYQTCDGCDEKKYSGHNYGTGGTCVCGKQKPEENTHTSHNWSETYTEDGEKHYQTCDGCEEKKYGDHDYGTGGTCVCGKQEPVTTIAVTGVTLNKTEIELEIDEAITLTATVAPENATNKTVSYAVEPAGVVTVSESGEVTAVAAGTATITATAANNKTATCSVTVTAPLTNADVLSVLNNMNSIKFIVENEGGVYNASNVKDVTWYVTKDGDNITGANLLFTYNLDTRDVVHLDKVDFSSPLTPQDIKAGKTGTPSYTRLYSNIIDTTIQAERAALTNAICDKLFGENQNATRYIIDNGFGAADPQYGDVSKFAAIEITDTYIKEKSIKISYANSDSGLIEKLSNSANYATYGEEKNAVITGVKLENNDQKF